jgi:flagellar biosynthesis protein FlhG
MHVPVDQASALRDALSPRGLRKHSRKPWGPRSVAIASGKGGVGKTFLATNLSIALAQQGTSVLLIDADLSLANVHILLGLQPKWDLAHVVRGEKRVKEILVEGPKGFHILPASSGVPEMAELSPGQLHDLVEECGRMAANYDLILIDLSAGVSSAVMAFLGAAHEALLVTTPEPTAYTDAYALLKVMRRRGLSPNLGLIINSARNDREGKLASEGLVRIGEQFLDLKLKPMGILPHDSAVPRSARAQRPVVIEQPRSTLARKIFRLAQQINANGVQSPQVPFFQGLGQEFRKAFIES